MNQELKLYLNQQYLLLPVSFALEHQRKNTASDSNITSESAKHPTHHNHQRYPNSVLPGDAFNLLKISAIHPGKCTPDDSVVEVPIKVQTKLKVSQPNDVYEQEAERIANQLISMPDSILGDNQSQGVRRGNLPTQLKRPSAEMPTNIQSKELSKDLPIHNTVLNSPGKPLDSKIREFFEPRFGWDFSQVRIHDGPDAEHSAKDLNADAYTFGRNIVYGARQFAPASREGRLLIAHELAHVVQQSGNNSVYVGQSNAKHGVSPNSHAVKATQHLAGNGSDIGLVQRRPASRDLKRRQRATVLNAADARIILKASLPFVLEHMTDRQIQQMQRVLDAAVVNPDVEKEAENLYRQSIVAQSGAVVNRDLSIVRHAKRAMESFIHITEADKRIRLDFETLLTPDALKATTDNPDEAAYLKAVRQTLATHGVWLRFEPKLVRDPEDPSRHVIDKRAFNVWLSLGPKGDTIPTESGQLSRKALLGTKLIGANYYSRVHKGEIQSTLDDEIRRLLSQINTGLVHHGMLALDRLTTSSAVVVPVDIMGGANFPDIAMWDQPRQFVLRAMQLKVGGNIRGSQAYLITAEILTRNAAELLASYVKDIGVGVERVVTVLKIAETAGEVAGILLLATGVVVGIMRAGTVAVAEAGAAGTEAATRASVDAAAEKLVSQYVAENPGIASDLANVRWVPGPRGSIGGRFKHSHSSGAGTGWHEW